jgi:hypothetical protein
VTLQSNLKPIIGDPTFSPGPWRSYKMNVDRRWHQLTLGFDDMDLPSWSFSPAYFSNEVFDQLLDADESVGKFVAIEVAMIAPTAFVVVAVGKGRTIIMDTCVYLI